MRADDREFPWFVPVVAFGLALIVGVVLASSGEPSAARSSVPAAQRIVPMTSVLGLTGVAALPRPLEPARVRRPPRRRSRAASIATPVPTPTPTPTPTATPSPTLTPSAPVAPAPAPVQTPAPPAPRPTPAPTFDDSGSGPDGTGSAP